MIEGIREIEFKKLSRKAAWVGGDGSYALIAFCRVPTITRHRTFEAAEAAKQTIDRFGCGGCCNGDHQIAVIE